MVYHSGMERRNTKRGPRGNRAARQYAWDLSLEMGPDDRALYSYRSIAILVNQRFGTRYAPATISKWNRADRRTGGPVFGI